MAPGKRKTITRSKKQMSIADSDRIRLRRFLFLWLPVILITLIIIYAFAFDPVETDSRASIEGTLLETSPSSTGSAGDQAYRVQLTNGQIILVSIFEKEGPKKNKRLLVEESSTLLFKRTQYRFIRFID